MGCPVWWKRSRLGPGRYLRPRWSRLLNVEAELIKLSKTTPHALPELEWAHDQLRSIGSVELAITATATFGMPLPTVVGMLKALEGRHQHKDVSLGEIASRLGHMLATRTLH